MNETQKNSTGAADATFPIRSLQRSLSPFRTHTHSNAHKVSSLTNDNDATMEEPLKQEQPQTIRGGRSLSRSPINVTSSTSTDATTNITTTQAQGTGTHTSIPSTKISATSTIGDHKNNKNIQSHSHHSTTSTGSASEDEVVKQARQAALHAAHEIQKTSQLTHSSGFQLGNLSLPQIQLQLGGGGGHKRAPIIGADAQQRKLIEDKLLQYELQQKQKEKEKMERDAERMIEPFKHVAEKFEGFIQESSQKIDDVLHLKKDKDKDKDKEKNKHPSQNQGRGQSHGQNDHESLSGDEENANTKSQGLVTILEQKEELSAIVWKRRSGYGRYSATKAWEKRRIVLKGSVIQYFKVKDCEKNAHGGIIGDTSNSYSHSSSPISARTDVSQDSRAASNASKSASISPTGASTSVSTTTNTAKTKKNFWDQAKENLHKAQENINKNIQQHMHIIPPSSNSNNNSNNDDGHHNTESDLDTEPTQTQTRAQSQAVSKYDIPRGQIDLIADHAIVAAMNSADSTVQNNATTTATNTTTNNTEANDAATTDTATAESSTPSPFTASSLLQSISTNHALQLPNMNLSMNIVNTPPPTPFGISIMVKNESTAKWKICFMSQKEQMDWLNLLTSVIVTKSVDVCNEGLKQKHKENQSQKHKIRVGLGGLGGLGIGAAVAIGHKNAASSKRDEDMGTTAPAATSTVRHGTTVSRTATTTDTNNTKQGEEEGEGREESLWKVEEQYSRGTILRAVSNSNATSPLLDATSASRDNDASTIHTTASSASSSEEDFPSPLAMLKEYIHIGSISGPNLCIARNNLCALMLVYNVSLFFIMSMERQSRVLFRFTVIFLNLVLWLLVVVVEEDNGDDDEKKAKNKKEGGTMQNSDKKKKTRINPLLEYLEQYLEVGNGTKPMNSSLMKPKSRMRHSSMRKHKVAVRGAPTITINDGRNKQYSSQTLSQAKDGSMISSSEPVSRGEGFKPVAGSTSRPLADGEDETFDYAISDDSLLRWTALSCNEVMVRSHGYLKSRKKISSPESMYEIFACDGLMDGARVGEIISKVQLPSNILEEYERNKVSDKERTWHSPDFFVASIAIPTEEPSLTRPTTDGGGLTCAVYYKMKKETRDILKRITAPNYDPKNDPHLHATDDVQSNMVPAVRLWERWCRTSPHDEKMQGRFKLIPNVHNPREVGLPSWISKYCGKPVLIKRANVTGFLSSHPQMNAMEFDITLHPFPYLAKKAMAYLNANVFSKAIVSLTYVVEGRDDDELPEVVIGDGVRLIRPDPDLVCTGEEFFKGIGKSYENGLKYIAKPQETNASIDTGTRVDMEKSESEISGDDAQGSEQLTPDAFEDGGKEYTGSTIIAPIQ